MSRIIKSVVLLGLAFAGYRLAQPRIRAYSFANLIKQEVESKQVRPSPGELHKRIIELGNDFGLNLQNTETDDDVTVTPLEGGGFEVKVHYDVPVDLGLYLYYQHFDFVTRTQTAALPQ
jgi:hypothetical protein